MSFLVKFAFAFPRFTRDDRDFCQQWRSEYAFDTSRASTYHGSLFQRQSSVRLDAISLGIESLPRAALHLLGHQ